jgi:hypothetical protein
MSILRETLENKSVIKKNLFCLKRLRKKHFFLRAGKKLKITMNIHINNKMYIYDTEWQGIIFGYIIYLYEMQSLFDNPDELRSFVV